MEGVRIKTETDRMILKKAQKQRNTTQTVLAHQIGVSQNALSQSMNRPRISLGMFAKILDALDYDVMIVNRETGEAEWQLYVEHLDIDDDI